MVTLYRNGEVREVPENQVDYLTGKTASSKTGFIPNAYSLSPETPQTTSKEIPNPYSTTPTQTPASTSTIPDRTTTTTPSKNIFDLYGVDKTSQPTDMYGIYGVTEPKYTKPVTTEYDTEIAKYKPTGDTSKIKEMLDKQLADIASKYSIEKENVKRQTASEFQSQLSGLYDVGVVNPLSSGTGSIDSASDEILDRRVTALNQAEGAEKAQAIARAYDLETEAQDKALSFAQQERARIEKQAEEQYTYDRQAMLDKIDMVNNVVNAWKAGKTSERQDKLDAQSNIMDLISTFGSGAFEGMDATKIAEIEKATGYPENSLLKGITTLKERELLEKNKMNLHTINGNLYNITQDKNGVIKTELVLAKTGSSSGSSSSGGKSGSGKIKSFDEWLNEKQETDQMTYNITEPTILEGLKNQYETEINQTGATGVKLTQTQYNTALGNYVKGTGGSEAEFTSLSPSQKTLWYRGGPEKEKTTSTSSASNTATSKYSF